MVIAFGYMGSFPRSKSGDKNAQRRSQRVMLNTSVEVVTRAADGKPVLEETRTVVVNAHGAVILLRSPVSMGQLLTLRNSKMGEEISCRVVYVSPHLLEKKEMGVEFMEPCPRLWGISFPPSNWTTRSPEAKGRH